MTILLGFIIGFSLFHLFDTLCLRVKWLKERFWDHPMTFFGYHVHHSFYGLLMCIIGFFYFPFLIGLGLGMIVSHTVTDRRLVFIEKQRKK